MAIYNIKFFLFGDFVSIEALPQKTMDISQKLINNGLSLMPGTFQQLNPLKGLKTFERILFNSQKDHLTVQIGMDIIEINKIIFLTKSYSLNSEIEKFISEIKKIIKSIDEGHESGITGLRVSLVVEKMYNNEKLKPYGEIFENFSKKIPNYEADETFEWNTRAVKRVSIKLLENDEDVNFVTDISRGLGQINNQGEMSEVETIHTRIDINTLDANKDLRINQDFIRDFLQHANKLFSLQNNEIEVKVVESAQIKN